MDVAEVGKLVIEAGSSGVKADALASELAGYVQSRKFPGGLAGSFIKTPIPVPGRRPSRNSGLGL